MTFFKTIFFKKTYNSFFWGDKVKASHLNNRQNEQFCKKNRRNGLRENQLSIKKAKIHLLSIFPGNGLHSSPYLFQVFPSPFRQVARRFVNYVLCNKD